MRGKKIGQKPPAPKKKKPGVTGVQKEQYLMKNKISDYLIELLGYGQGMKLPTITYKKIEEYRNTCGFEVLYETIKKVSDSIRWAVNNKEFRNEVGKISYIFAIIQNNIGEDYLEKKKFIEEEHKTRDIDVIPADLNIHNDYVRKARDLSEYI